MTTRERAVEVIAQAYCTKRNENKVVDPDLLMDCVDALISAGLIKEELDEEEVKKWLDERYPPEETIDENNETIAHAICSKFGKPEIKLAEKKLTCRQRLDIILEYLKSGDVKTIDEINTYVGNFIKSGYWVSSDLYKLKKDKKIVRVSYGLYRRNQEVEPRGDRGD